MNELEQSIRKIFEERDCTVINFTNKGTPIEYICKCGETKKKLYKDFVRRGCRTCNSNQLYVAPEGNDYIVKETGEIWKPVVGGWVSSFGNAKNPKGQFLTLCPEKFRYRINKKHQYASRLVADAFKIQNYEKLKEGQIYVVTHLDKNPANNRVENLKIIDKSAMAIDNGKKSRQSDVFRAKMGWDENKFADLESVTLPELPNHKIYSNGEFWNGQRFLVFSKHGKYLQISCISGTIPVHRLVCYAFHPLPDKKCFEDYKDLQVNHKNGIPTDNNASNLEWCDQSHNMTHAYATYLNKRSKLVIQLDKNENYLGHFMSIANASKATGEPEHRITQIATGQQNSKAIFQWKFAEEIDIEKEYYKVKNIWIPFHPAQIIIIT
jgi:hypothetical protein